VNESAKVEDRRSRASAPQADSLERGNSFGLPRAGDTRSAASRLPSTHAALAPSSPGNRARRPDGRVCVREARSARLLLVGRVARRARGQFSPARLSRAALPMPRRTRSLTRSSDLLDSGSLIPRLGEADPSNLSLGCGSHPQVRVAVANDGGKTNGALEISASLDRAHRADRCGGVRQARAARFLLVGRDRNGLLAGGRNSGGD
jgi:hypothetical protein